MLAEYMNSSIRLTEFVTGPQVTAKPIDDLMEIPDDLMADSLSQYEESPPLDDFKPLDDLTAACAHLASSHPDELPFKGQYGELGLKLEAIKLVRNRMKSVAASQVKTSGVTSFNNWFSHKAPDLVSTDECEWKKDIADVRAEYASYTVDGLPPSEFGTRTRCSA